MIDRITNMSSDFVRKIASDVLDPDHAVVIIVKRDKSQDTTYKRSDVKFTPAAGSGEGGSEDFLGPRSCRRAEPDPAPGSRDRPRRRSKFTLGNGMKVILLPTQAMLPIVTAQLVFGVGSAREPSNKSGLAQIAAEALSPPAVADIGAIAEMGGAENGDGEMASAFGMFGIRFGGSRVRETRRRSRRRASTSTSSRP